MLLNKMSSNGEDAQWHMIACDVKAFDLPELPLILFCDDIVGRITPPRVAGASGSESLCNR